MANEITISGGLSGLLTSTGDQLPPLQFGTQADWSSKKYVDRTYDLTTTPGDLDLGDIATVGYVLFKNLDTTNNALIGSDGSLWQIVIQPGKSAGPMQWNAAAINAKSSASTVKLQARILST